jgi:hypothetical protein
MKSVRHFVRKSVALCALIAIADGNEAIMWGLRSGKVGYSGGRLAMNWWGCAPPYIYSVVVSLRIWR